MNNRKDNRKEAWEITGGSAEGFKINFGPQHPSTHGILRLILELEGETIKSADSHIGLLHRGTEKIMENKTYIQSIPYLNRLDYISPLAQEESFALAVERLLECEVPRRAQYIRVMMLELTRILNHLLVIATQGMDVGAMTPLLWCFEEREKIGEFYERISGSRFHTCYIRPGGVNTDIPKGLLEDVEKYIIQLKTRIDEVEEMLTNNRIWKQRLVGIGVVTEEEAVNNGFTGPMLRGSGVAFDLRKEFPYDVYNEMDFKIPVGINGDCYDRYLLRMEEMRESIKIVLQCVREMPEGLVRSEDMKITPPSRERMKKEMEGLIEHYKLYSEGYEVPRGEIYAATESPKGEFGVYIVSEGGSEAYRCRIRSPSFIHLAGLGMLIKGHMIADVVTIIGSLDIVFGDVDR